MLTIYHNKQSLKPNLTTLGILFVMSLLPNYALANSSAITASVFVPGIYIGVSIALLVNIWLMRSRYFNRKIAFFYSGYCICLMLASAVEIHLFDFLLPASSTNIFYLSLMLLSSVFFNQFEREFMETKKYDNTGDILLKACSIISLAVIILMFLFPAINPFHITGIYALAGILVMIFCVSRAIKRQTEQIQNFVLGSAFLSAGVVTWALGAIDIIESNIFVTNGIRWGGAIEIIILFYAISRQVAAREKAAQEAEFQALSAKQEIKNQQILSLEREKNARLEEIGFTSLRISDRVNTPLTVINLSVEEIEDLTSTLPSGILQQLKIECSTITSASAAIESEVKDLRKTFINFSACQDVAESYESRLNKILHNTMD